jgi:hypothetical protein
MSDSNANRLLLARIASTALMCVHWLAKARGRAR